MQIGYRIYLHKYIHLQGMILGLLVAANHFQISCQFEFDSCFVSPSLITIPPPPKSLLFFMVY